MQFLGISYLFPSLARYTCALEVERAAAIRRVLAVQAVVYRPYTT
jgi:hypothetical protein